MTNLDENTSDYRNSEEDRRFWSKEEHSLMVEFLNMKRDEMIKHINDNLAHAQRKNKSQFFIEMARHIGTKNKSQCKSRFQKRECDLIGMLNLPRELLEAYFLDKEKKKKAYTAKRNTDKEKHGKTSKGITNNYNSKNKDPSIRNYMELKEALKQKIIPKIVNDDLKNTIMDFISTLPVDNGFNHLIFHPIIPRPDRHDPTKLNRKIAKPQRKIGFVKFTPKDIRKFD